jgi:hypothetical protein
MYGVTSRFNRPITDSATKANTDRNRYQLYTLFANKQNLFVKSKNVFTGPSWPWSHGSWINNYLCNRCLSPLMLWVQISLFSRCTTLYIYGPCCTEIWNNVFLKKSYFSKVCLPEEVIFPEGLFTRRSHISRRFVYPKKKYDFLEKYDFFGWIMFHISLQPPQEVHKELSPFAFLLWTNRCCVCNFGIINNVWPLL